MTSHATLTQTHIDLTLSLTHTHAESRKYTTYILSLYTRFAPTRRYTQQTCMNIQPSNCPYAVHTRFCTVTQLLFPALAHVSECVRAYSIVVELNMFEHVFAIEIGRLFEFVC